MRVVVQGRGKGEHLVAQVGPDVENDDGVDGYNGGEGIRLDLGGCDYIRTDLDGELRLRRACGSRGGRRGAAVDGDEHVEAAADDAGPWRQTRMMRCRLR